MKKLIVLSLALIALAGPAHAAFVPAAVAWVGSALAAGGIAAAFIQTAIGIGVSLLAQAILGKDIPKAKADVELDIQIGDDLPLTFCVGDFATAGKRKYVGSWGRNNRFISQVIEYSALPQGLADLWIDDGEAEYVTGRVGAVAVADGPDGTGPMGDFASGSVPGTHILVGQTLDNYHEDGDGDDPRIWIKAVDGTQTAADPFLVWAFGSDPDYPWTAEMVGTGKSYLIVTVQFDDETLTSYPNFLIEPEPLALYDLRFDSTNGGSGSQRWTNPATWQPTTNPAVIAYNLIRGIYYGSEWIYGGKNLPAWRLPAAEWIAAANECDDPVTLAGGGTEPRYRCGLEISVDVPPADYLEEIGKAANMKFAEVGGQIKPIVGLPASAVFSFTDDDILITEGQSFQPFYPASETFNTISATYPQPGEKWATKDAKEYTFTEAQEDDGGRYLPISVSYPAVPYAKQVQRLMRAQMRDFRRMRRHQFYLPPDAYSLEPGVDMVSWTSDRNGYIAKLFMVESVAKTPGMNVLVSLREVNPGDYDWSSDFESPVTITVPKNPVRYRQPINGLVVEPVAILDPDGVTRRPAIRVRCDGDETGVTSISLKWREANQTDQISGRVAEFDEPYRWLIRNVLPGTAYQVQAQLLSRITPKSQPSAWFDVTTYDLGLTWDDFEASVKQAVDDAQAQADAAAAAAQEADENADAVRDELTAATASLDGDIADAVQLANDNLLVAQGYTDTSVQSESAARVTGDEALAAQIQTLTAVLNSENYIENARFSDGLTGWVGDTGDATVVAQDDLSADPIIENAPTSFFVSVTTDPSANTDLWQDFPIDWETNEVFQWRVYAAAGEASREARVVIQWFDDLGAVISTPQTVMNLVEDEWRVFSGQHTPPAGAVDVRFRLRVPAVASAGPIAFADVSFTKVDQSVIARITDLEVVVANDEQALATYITTANARMGDIEADVATETATRASETGALASQITTVSAAANRVRTFRIPNAPTNPSNGDIWYNTSNDNRAYRWWNDSWLPVDDARIGPIEASVTTQATAISDLQGNASAGYLIKAQAGGVASLIDLIAADGSAGTVSVAKIDAQDILLKGSVAADMLTVMDLSGNMVPDAEMVSASAWNIGSAGDWWLRAPESFNWSQGESAGEVVCTITGSYSAKTGLTFSVLQGVEYAFSGIMRPFSGDNGVGEIAVVWFDVDGVQIQQDWFTSLSGTGYVKQGRSLVAPTGARKAAIRLRAFSNNQSTLGFSSISCIRKRTGTTLITPGGVTADLVTSSTMRALNGQFVDLQAANIAVGTAEIDTLNLAGNSVTVPASQTLSNWVNATAIGNWTNSVNVVTINLSQPGSVVIIWNGEHVYTSVVQDEPYGLRLRVNGTVEWVREVGYGGVGSDWPNMSWRMNLPAGSHTFRMDWYSGNSVLRLRNRTLIVMGVMR